MRVSNYAAYASQQSSSSELRPSTSSNRAPIKTFVDIITKTVTLSATTAIHTIFPSSVSPSNNSNSIPNAPPRFFISSTPSTSFQPLVCSPLHIDTTAMPFTTLGPIPTTKETVVTPVIALTGSSPVHIITTATSSALFQPSNPSDDGPPLDIIMIVLIVLGTVAVCSLFLSFIWWYKGRRYRPSDSDMYRFSEKPENLAWGERLRRALGKHTYSGVESNPRQIMNLFTVGSFGNNRGRTTPTPFPEQISTDVIQIGRPELSSPHVRFQKSFRDSESDPEDGVQHGIGESTTGYNRPPSYYTNSTGLATIATTLPQYSAVVPSPISEHSDTSTTPISSPLMPLFSKGRGSGRPLARFSPRIERKT
ncbi:hypothetical protein Agabi119p4_9406 [Agaricus bisporus var. burnettii]|uniref:Uncharacterized protein n=1 Tax=Agaricus bisporus var. burnettii TaxID=192524 RepID=A0A8H7C2B1_AGABI|nr:hypothetical protein Agabi119p4_9406 [Agaricus bisporus var. burnettii]